MITGVGIDIVHIKRMEKWLLNSSLLQRYFHPEELSYAFSLGKRSAQTLAARFAAKEAFGKAIGTGLANINLKEILVHNEKNGKPVMKLSGTAKKAMEEAGAGKVHISLTHESDNAVAMVVLEGV